MTGLSKLCSALRREGLADGARALLVWKLWRPLQERAWRSRCRRRERARPCDLSERSWRAAATHPLPLDWYSPHFPLSRAAQERLVDGPERLDAAAVAACLERCERIEAGDFSWLIAGAPPLGATPDWHALLDRPGAWPAGPSADLDYLSEARPGDIRRCWELNRHQYFLVLGRGWRLSRDRRWSRCFARHLDDWIARNPCRQGPNWAQAQEVALRGISWCWAWHLFHDAPDFSEGLRRRMLQALSWHLRFLECEIRAFDKWTHNHLISELAGVHLISVHFPQFTGAPRLARWSRNLLLRETEKQVWPDGMAGELATGYLCFVLETLAGVLACRRESWRGTVLERRVAAMGGAVAWLLRPDGSLPLVGDSDDGRGWLLAEGQEGRAALAQLPGLLSEEAPAPWIAARPSPQWRWLSEDVAPTPARREGGPRFRLFHAGGIWCWRDGDGADSSWLLFRGGATARRRWVQQGHHHADLLSFEYVHAGRQLFLDPGSYAYGLESELRLAFRGCRAHNGLFVEGWEPCDFRGLRFGVWELPLSEYLEEPGSAADGIAMGFSAGPVRHERRLRPTPGGFRLDDFVRRPAGRPAGLGFQLAPGLRVEPTPRGWRLPQLELELRVAGGVGREIEEGSVSRRYGRREAAPRLRVWLPSAPECRVTFELDGA
jgi:hypothetical protein